MLTVSDFRGFKATLKALTEQEINKEPFTNGLKYLVAGNEEEGIASTDKYRVFREKLARMEDPRSGLVNLRPVMEPIVYKISWEQYYAFLHAVTKMPTKLEGDCPGIAVWSLATGPSCPRKVKNIQISPQSMLSCSRQETPTKLGALVSPLTFPRNALLYLLLPWSLWAREKGDSLV